MTSTPRTPTAATAVHLSPITLDEADLPEAITVVAHAVAEIPLYRWLLGEHVDDDEKRRWLAALLIRPLLRVGCAVGVRDESRLVGVLLWQPHDVDLAPDGSPPLTVADVEVAARTPGLRERLLELWTTQPLPRPVDDAVCCVLSALTPGARGGQTLFALMRPVEEFCERHRRPFYAWTGTPALRDWFAKGWDAAPFGTIEWDGVELYGVVLDRPQPTN